MLAKTGQMAKLTQRTNPLESGRSRAWQRSNGSTTCYGIAEMSTVRLCAAMMPCLMIIGCAGPMGVIHGGTVAAAGREEGQAQEPHADAHDVGALAQASCN